MISLKRCEVSRGRRKMLHVCILREIRFVSFGLRPYNPCFGISDLALSILCHQRDAL
jgi:hypothetical protein